MKKLLDLLRVGIERTHSVEVKSTMLTQNLDRKPENMETVFKRIRKVCL